MYVVACFVSNPFTAPVTFPTPSPEDSSRSLPWLSAGSRPGTAHGLSSRVRLHPITVGRYARQSANRREGRNLRYDARAKQHCRLRLVAPRCRPRHGNEPSPHDQGSSPQTNLHRGQQGHRGKTFKDPESKEKTRRGAFQSLAYHRQKKTRSQASSLRYIAPIAVPPPKNVVIVYQQPKDDHIQVQKSQSLRRHILHNALAHARLERRSSRVPGKAWRTGRCAQSHLADRTVATKPEQLHDPSFSLFSHVQSPRSAV